MKRYRKALVNISVALFLLVAAFVLIPRMLVFFAPFVAGWIISLLAGSPVRFFEEKMKLKRKIGSAFVIVVVIALVVLLIYFLISWLTHQALGLLNSLPDMWAGMEADFADVGEGISRFIEKLPGMEDFDFNDVTKQIGIYLGDLLGRIGTPTIEAAGNLAKQLPAVFIGMIMALLSAYFFVAERTQINDWCRKHAPVSLQMQYHMVCRSLQKSVGGYFKAQLKIEVWMYLLLLVGLGLLHVSYFALIALVIAFLDLLPFLGTGTVLIPWAIIKIMTADYKMAVWLLIIWSGGQLARQLIQPKFVGDSIGVAPFPTLFLLFLGYKLGGVLGMVIAVPLGLLIYTMYQEGTFETTRKSILILVAGANRFRRIEQEDLFEVNEMERKNAEAFRELNEQYLEKLREKEAADAERIERKKRKKETKKTGEKNPRS